MRKTVYTFILAIIFIPIVLLTSSCKKDDVSPVGTTHPFAGSSTVIDSVSLGRGQMIVNVDGDFNFTLSLFRDSLTTRNTHTITGNVATNGQLNGRILDSVGVQKGTISGSLSATTGIWSYLTSTLQYARIWSKRD